MSAETRMLPRKTPRSTGIERTTQQVARPGVAGTGGLSHVSAAPGAGAAAHAHVLNARNPAAAVIARGPGGKGQDATVAIIDRKTGQVMSNNAPARTLSAQRPLVEIVDRRQGYGQQPAQVYGAPAQASGPISSPFTRDETNLIGSLLSQYHDRVVVVEPGGKGVALVIGALKALTELAMLPPAPERHGPTAATPEPVTIASASAPTPIAAKVSVVSIPTPVGRSTAGSSTGGADAINEGGEESEDERGEGDQKEA